MAKDPEVFNQLSYNKTKIIEIGLIAISIALGIKLLGSIIYDNLFWGWSLVIGIVLISIGILFLFSIKVGGFRHEYKFYGFLLRDKENDQFIKVDKYELSQDFCQFFDSVLTEDDVIKKQWKQDSLDEFSSVKNNKTVGDKSLKSYRIVSEVLEYIVLDTISWTLFDYYNKNMINGLKEINREDIPEILLNNRVLELISKMPEDRDFDNNNISDNTILYSELSMEEDEEGNLRWSGKIYKNFNLKLPQKCSIQKSEDDFIVLESKYFKIKIRLTFSPFDSSLSNNFKKYYLGINKKDIHNSRIICDIKLKLKVMSFLSYKGWKNYKWVDTLITSFRKKVDERNFMNKINWSTNEVLIKIFK